MSRSHNNEINNSTRSIYICFVICILWSYCCNLVASVSVTENQSAQRYLPNVALGDEQLKQMIKGVGAADANWRQRAKPEVTDVKTELAKLNTTYVYQNDWPANDVKLGAVTAVSLDGAGNVVIFHRVDRIWNSITFNNSHVYQERNKGPIKQNTVLGLEPETGKVLYEWGKNFFYMPHGLSIDPEENVWVTDVALHQVFKFPPRGVGGQPLLTLGTAFQPGAGKRKFCKPTAVAVLNNGDFFVADGYCNSRIVKYSKEGEQILVWGQNSFSGYSYDVSPVNFFAIPHALTLVPELELLCAADRENGRVQCFYSNNGSFHSQYHNPLIGDRLFSMAYTPSAGGQLVIVNGPTGELGISPQHYNEVHGFVMSMRTSKLISKFGPNNLEFQNPHDVAVTADGNAIYVAELNPMRIHKFVHKSLAKPMSLSVQKMNSGESETSVTSTSTSSTRHHPSGKAILVASLMLLFAGSTFVLALIMARRRKRGCLPFGTHSRRHAWEKSEGFKLGGLLDRNGFEKLDQNASDEEQEQQETTTLSQQYA
ncbi:peptidyl-alpha-hydroxyglycine alpha-amidating lyase 1 [Drosophila sulfurigaster albostrigata]|uniref:peptidyl-alpha-hydroxyglycine alpha-amidating lyase 1 n=1 Tax=Drosophila sulfurigaster albostrigata TaxID=89887 RepID=UPI002D21C19E|nr:peptidyl-alpha-hydroxyglycine alpha-amidating lyase 1 [Drosophila sulfurigaster albostrigata]